MTRELEFFEYLGSLKHDLFLLQETHIQTEDIGAWSAEWGGGACFWNPGGNNSFSAYLPDASHQLYTYLQCAYAPCIEDRCGDSL